MATPNIDDLMAQYGYNSVAPAHFNPAAAVQEQPAPKSQSGFSVGNLAGSVAHLAGQAAGWVGHQIVDPVYHAGRAVAEGLPGVGTIDQHYKAQAQIQKQVDSMMKDASARYRSTDPKVHISKDEYLKRLTAAQKLSQQSNQDTQDFTKNLETPGSAASGLAETGLMLTGLGELKAAAVAGKGLAKLTPDLQAALEGATGKVIGKVAPKTAKALMPAEGAAVAPGGSLIKGGVKSVGKFALATKPAADAAIATPGDIQHGNYGNVGLNAAAFVGAPLAAKVVGKLAPGIIKGASNLIFNKAGSEINKLKFQGGETVSSYLNGLKTADPKKWAKYNDIAKVAEDHYSAEGTKAYDLTAYHASNKMPIKDMSAEQFLNMQHDLAHSTKMAQALNEKGRLNFVPEALQQEGRLSKEEARVFKSSYGVPETYGDRLGVGRWDGAAKAGFTRQFLAAAGPSERAQLIKDAADRGEQFTRNPLIMHNLQSLAFEQDPAKIKAGLNGITGTRQIGIVGSGRTGLRNGYIPIIKPEGSAGFKSATEAAELGKPVNAPFATVGNALRKAGLSPEGTDPKEFGKQMTTNFDNNLAGTRFEGHGGKILSKMFEYMDQTKGIFDPRLIKLSDLSKALDVPREDAKLLRSALDHAYTQVPLGARSLGEKLTDHLISKFPGERQYLKAQSYGRFAANPIFWVKRDIKTDLVAGAEVGGKAPNLGGVLNRLLGNAPSDDTLHLLKERGFFSKGMSQVGDVNDFLGDYRSTFAQGSVKENLSKQALSNFQQQSLGQMAEKFAKLHGTDVKSLLQDNGELGSQFDHLMRLTVGYGQKSGETGGYLTSNLAKSLNVLVFPSRFDTKVGMAFAKFYSQQPPIIQGAIAKGAINAALELNSPAGQQWQRDNSELLGILKYFTPLETVGTIMTGLLHPGQVNPPDFGAIGGLPIGVLTTIAQHQGVAPDWLKSSPYHDPKTGNLVPETLPNSDKARLQSVITDIISSMYSYPGKTLGLPLSKTQATQAIPGLKPGAGETRSVDPSTGADVPKKGLNGDWINPQDAIPASISGFKGPGLATFNTDVIDHSKYAKPKKPKAPPAYLHGFKTRTARPIK